MTPFVHLDGVVALLDRDNVDTDQILPARFLRKQRTAGYQNFLFFDLRAQEPEFPVQPGACSIVVAGENFGCGSSREGAVYALVDAGIRCVIAPGFGDIFAGNAAKNGLLTIVLAEAPRLLAGLAEIVVDLPAQTLALPDGRVLEFAIDDFRKRCLLEGLDDIGLTLQHAEALAAFERARPDWTVPA